MRARYDCPAPIRDRGVVVHSSLIPGSSLDHLHFMRWRVVADGEPIDEGHGALGRGSRRFAYGGEAEGLQSATFGAMVGQGILHVVFGYDHVAFLLTLILVSWFLARRPSHALAELLRLALGFTLGHSLTLGLAATSTVGVAEPTVEFLIALSVAGLAFEGLLRGRFGDRALRWGGIGSLALVSLGSLTGVVAHSPFAVIGTAVFIASYGAIRDPGPWTRASVATVFGLIHGFGFAGALSELHVGGTSLLTSLLAFNVGVEVGQWVIIGWGSRHAHRRGAPSLPAPGVRVGMWRDAVAGAVLGGPTRVVSGVRDQTYSR